MNSSDSFPDSFPIVYLIGFGQMLGQFLGQPLEKAVALSPKQRVTAIRDASGFDISEEQLEPSPASSYHAPQRPPVGIR